MNGNSPARVYMRNVRFSQVFRSDSWCRVPEAALFCR